VGRRALLGVLERDLAACRDGRGGLVLLSGEAGIGKTRTAEELARRAEAAGVRPIHARCAEVPGAPALWPWQQVLRRLASAGDGARDLPEGLRARLENGAASPSSLDGAEMERFLFFEAIAERLLEAARRQPCLLVLDDLHRADAPSVGALAHLAGALERAPLLAVGTWREAEMEEGALAEALPTLGRHGRRLALEGLGAAELAELVADLAGRRPAPAVARALHERSGGNPLFARQLAGLLLAEGADLACEETAARVREVAPRGLHDLIRGRLDRLPRALRTALRLAAVAGRDFEPELLKAVWRRASEAPDASGLGGSAPPPLDPALDAGVLRACADAPGRLEFGHVLLRDVLYHELAPDTRARAHRALAEAISATRDLREDATLAAAAHHAVAAGPSREALDLAERAGRRALARHGHEDARHSFEAALACLARQPALGTRGDRARLLLHTGVALWRGGAPAEARKRFAEAFALARAEGDADTAAAAAIGLAGRTDLTLGPEDEATRVLEQALEGLGPEPSRLRAELLARLATALYFSADGKWDRVSREALACAESLGDPAPLAYALSARHYVLYRPGTLAERQRIAQRQLALARRGDDPNTTALAHLHGLIDGLEAGDLGQADRHLADLGELAARLRQPFHAWQHAAFTATLALARGRLDEGERLAEAALARGQEIGSPNAVPLFAGQLYVLRRDQGRLAELEPLLSELNEGFPSVPSYGFGRAEAWLARGASAEARAFFRAACGAESAPLPHDFNWGASMSVAVRLCVALGEAEHAEPLYASLTPLSGTCFVIGYGTAWDGAVDLALGELATLLGHLDEAERYLAAAERLHARLGARGHLARTWRAQARWHARRAAPGDTARAAALAGQAGALARELGMAGVAAEAEREAAGAEAGVPGDTPRPPESASTAPERVAPGPHPGATEGRPDDACRFARGARGWTVRFSGREAALPDARGMAYLAALLDAPEKPIHVLDLVALHAPGDAPRSRGADVGELLDARGRREVRTRLHELAAALEASEAHHDLARAAALREEITSTESYLVAALGLGGRARRAGDPVERARKSVYNRLRDAIARIETAHPELGRHLRASIRTGRVCRYAPERPVAWHLD